MIELHNSPIKFHMRIESKNPEVIKKRKMVTVDDFAFDPMELRGTYYRVIPTNAREVFFLASLEKYVDKWAPAKGNGVIVRTEIIDGLSYNRK
jgi:hypothetical protein